MKAWILCLIAIISGCSATPVALPEWQQLDYAETEVSDPVALPSRPIPASHTDSSVTFDLAAFDQLIAYMDVADANYESAVALVNALEAQTRAYNHLIDAGRMQAEISVLRQQLLEQERADHRFDNIFHRLIILLGIGAAL